MFDTATGVTTLPNDWVASAQDRQDERTPSPHQIEERNSISSHNMLGFRASSSKTSAEIADSLLRSGTVRYKIIHFYPMAYSILLFTISPVTNC